MHPLPEGLVTSTSDPYPSASPGLVDVANIARLWRVFNTNPRIHPGTAGHRLENLFWRIWSSGRLLSSLDGATLARLFELIADQPSQDGQSIDKHKPTARPPPILKKQPPQSSHPELPKTTRLLLTSPEGQNFTRNPSNPPTPIAAPAAAAATPPRPGPGNDEMPKHKKTLFAASTTTRRRPARRSARSARLHSPPSPSPSPSPPSPTPTPMPAQQPSPLGSEAWVDLSDGEEEVPEDDAKPRLPPSFVANLRAHMKAHPARTTAAAAAAGPTTTTADPQTSDAELRYSWYRQQPTKTALVDRDFRSRFAEQVVQARAVQAAQVAEAGSSSSGSEAEGGLIEGGCGHGRQGQGCCQPVHPVHGAAGHAVSGSFDNGLTMASGSCAVLTDAGSSASVNASMQGRSFNATPGSNEVSSYGQLAGEAGTPSSGSGSQIRMDISFEELEELSPMVW